MKQDVGTIYVITNGVNGKKYIGQTWYTIKYRFKCHVRQKKCVKLARAINKYGSDNFSIQAIATANNQIDLDTLECKYIKDFDTVSCGYNCTSGGFGGKPSPESRAKMSAARKGKKLSDETKLKISQNSASKYEYVKRKISEATSKKTNAEILGKIKDMVGCGMSQQKVAQIFGLCQSYVSRIINGNRRSL
jgi:group I intron endonuclease